MKRRWRWLAGGFAAGIAALSMRSRAKRSRRRRVDGDRGHDERVARVVSQLRSRPNGVPVSLHKAAPPHQVPKFGDLRRNDDKIDVSALTRILAVDPVARTCTAEAGAMFEDVVAATLAYGLIPIVVPELKTITIGGAVTGCSVESMSFVHGGFHDTCLEYEIITSTGEILIARPDNDLALVFQMMQSSFGTLGILAKLTFALVPAKPFVHVEYERHASFASYRASIEQHARARDVDFMDGIIHAPDRFVLSVGCFVERVPYHHAYDWMRIYYESTATRDEDYLRSEDYLFRYDRGVTNVHPRSLLGRLFLGKLLDSGTTLRLAELLHRVVLEKDRPTITLDVFLPMSKVEEFLGWYREEFGFFPLWVVPYRRVHDYEWLADSFYAGLEDDMFVDLAIYGMKQTGDKDYHRLMEAKLRELGGVKTLISHNYYTRDEFWQIWNKPNYDAVKSLTDPRNLFRDLYTKTCVTAMGRG
jgi:FAD/FMN-containing dehydrogenase